MGFEFVCPIGGAGAGLPPWHAAVHLGLTGIVVTAGAILLVAGIIQFRASAPSRAPLPDRAATGARRSAPAAGRRSPRVTRTMKGWIDTEAAIDKGLTPKA